MAAAPTAGQGAWTIGDVVSRFHLAPLADTHAASSRHASGESRGMDELPKSVGSRGELGFDPTVDASIEDLERQGAAREDLVMEGL
jgi:hypothetical protein